MALALRRHLLKAYGSFADKRIRNLEKSGIFIADDRTQSDVGSDGLLYGYFCMIFASADSDTEIVVDVRGNIPRSPGVERFFRANKISVAWSRIQPSAELVITRDYIALLRELAGEFDSMSPQAGATRRPTTNMSVREPPDRLRRLARILDDYSWQKQGFFCSVAVYGAQTSATHCPKNELRSIFIILTREKGRFRLPLAPAPFTPVSLELS